MKKLIKTIYMVISKARVLLRCKKRGKNCFVGRRASINKPQYISFSDNVRIGNDARLSFYDSFNGNMLSPSLSFGNNTYIGNNFTVLCADEIIIEDDVLIASYVMISSENHGIDPESELRYSKQSLKTNPVHICKGVWIGEKVSVLLGVTIGEKSIIGAGSIVTKSIPAFSIAVGIPAKVIKQYDFDDHCWKSVETIDKSMNEININ